MKCGKVKLLHMTTVPMSLMFLRGQLRYYKKNGFEVHVLSSPGQYFDEVCQEEGVIQHEVEMERGISVFKDIKSLIKVIKIMKKNEFNIVHTHTPKASLLGIISAFLTGIRNRIYHMHGQVYVTKKGFKRKILYLMEKITITFSTQIYAVSPSLKEYVIEEGLTKREKIKVINKGSINGLDSAKHFAPHNYDVKNLQQEFNLTEEKFIIGFVGRVVKEKGFLELYYAWRSLREKHQNLKFLIVGDFEGDKEISESIVKDVMSNPDIIFLGFKRNTAPYYLLMDVLVFPTYREGFGLVAIESLAMETPVIASSVVGCIDTVEDGKTGYLIPPNSIESIIEKVEIYINNNFLIYEHGQMGRKKVINDYPRRVIWETMLQEYNNLLKKDESN